MSAVASTRTDRLVAWLIKWRWLVLGVAMLVGSAGAVRTLRTYAALRSDIEELLPQSAPSVASLAMLRQRLPSLRYLGVVVDTGSANNVEAASRFVDDLAARVEGYPGELVGLVKKDLNAERDFLAIHALKFVDPEDLTELREAAERRRDWEVSRELGTNLLPDGEDPRPEIPLAKLRQKYTDRFGGARRSPGDRFVSDDGRTVVLVIQAASHATSYEADQALLSRVKRDIKELGFPEAYASGMRVGFAADVATRVEEMEGLAADLTLSGVIVTALVLGSLLWFFGTWRALPVLGIPLLLGTLTTFGLVALPPLSIRHLNTNTAFLGSVIVGNGINSGIILLARYAERRRCREGPEAAIATAVRVTWRPTLAAALAAASAYSVLVFTDFRGFSQFGWIGGVGMITCYAMTLLLVPPLTVLVGRDIVARGRAGASMLSLQRFLAWILRRPRGILLATAALTLLSIGGLVHRGTDWLEHDFSRLRRADSFVSGERYWGRRMDATLRRYLTPTVVMVHDSEQAARVERRLHQVAQEGKAGGLIGSIQSGHRLLEASQRKAILQLRKLRELMTGRLLSALDTETRRLLRTALSDDSLRVLRPEDFPASLVAGFRERNGQLARTVLVYPKLTQGTWEGPRIREFTEDLRAAARSADPRARVAGSLPLSSDIAAAMKHDGPRATALGLMAALVICTMAFGSLRLSIASVASLIVGVVLMMGTLGWSGARLNFLNFVVLPITFGISADYAINILRRYQSERTDRNNEGLAHTAGAVALCSATTIIGFGSLITANNQALYSFGVFAVAGEVTMLATATLSLPAFLALRARRTASALVGRALPGGAR